MAGGAASGAVPAEYSCSQRFPIGREYAAFLSLSQAADVVSGYTVLANVIGSTGLFNAVSDPFAATIAGDGGLVVSSRYATSTVRVNQDWSLRVTTLGRGSGAVTHAWSFANGAGQLLVTGTPLSITCR